MNTRPRNTRRRCLFCPLPDGAVAAEAAAAFHSAATAFIGPHHRARTRGGQTILVGGAAGGIGSALVRYASEAGLRVIATARPADIMPLDKTAEAHALVDSRQSARAIIHIGWQP